MDDIEKSVLREYVHEQSCNANCKLTITRVLQRMPRATMTVYRGQGSSKEIRPTDWFSTSKSKKEAKEGFTRNTCCLFTLHLEDIPVLDVYEHIPRGSVADEDEVIVLGRGTFYSDSSMRTPGFKDRGNGEFEAWYKISDSVPLARRTTAQLDTITQDLKDEMDLIDSSDNLTMFYSDLNKEEREYIFNKLKSGGKHRKTRRRNRRNNTRKSRNK